MIQFFRFDGARATGVEFRIISGSATVGFFLKRILYLILFVYSTLFLAAAIPFVKTPFMPVYFVGGLASMILLIRTVSNVISFARFGGGSISVSPEGVKATGRSGKWDIPAESITYMEHSVLGNLVIRQKGLSISFPLALLSKNDRKALVSQFEDMAPKRTTVYRKIWEFIDAVAVALVLAVHIIQYIMQAYYIPTGSMEDTLLVGDHLFVEKITYGPIIPQMMGMSKPLHVRALGVRDIRRGDIVIFRPPHEEDKDYIKRCIAVPGDRIEFRNGSVYINDKKLDEPYTKGLTYDQPHGPQIQGEVPQGKLVVLGDNRENSMDGRYFGYLDIERIKGRAFILYWNTNQILKSFDFSRFGLIR
jgi:signal peptidase I